MQCWYVSVAATEPCVFCAWLRLRTFLLLEENIMSFSENFKAARKKSGLSQQQLADELKLDRSAIAHYEKGTAMPNAKNIYKICKILNVPFDELFSDDI